MIVQKKQQTPYKKERPPLSEQPPLSNSDARNLERQVIDLRNG